MAQFPDGDNRGGADIIGMVGSILHRAAELGFLGSMAIDEQIEHALGFRQAVENYLGRSPASALDLGTGGGIPGLVLAAAWPDAQVTLFDSSQRRTEFLKLEIEEWGVSHRVKVVRGRAEEAGRLASLRGAFEIVTARSFGTPAVTAECAAPFLVIEGILVVAEPPAELSSGRWPQEGLSTLGLEPLADFRAGGKFGYKIMQKCKETPDRYPRRTGIPVKRPLF